MTSIPDAFQDLFVKHVYFINAYLKIYNAIQNAVLLDGQSTNQNTVFQRKDTDVTATKSMSFEIYFLFLMNLKLHWDSLRNLKHVSEQRAISVQIHPDLKPDSL